MRNQKLNFTSLKKTNNLKNLLHSPKNKSIKTDGPYYLLPLIDKSIATTAYHKPTSILTRYISYHAHKLIKTTEENIKKPAFLDSIEKQFMSKKSKNKKIVNKTQQPKSKNISNELNEDNSDSKDKETKRIKNFYLTAQDTKDVSPKSKNNNSISNNYYKKLQTESNNNWNNDLDFNFFEKNLNGDKNTFGYGGIRRKFESSMSLDRQLNKDKQNLLNNTFHRLRTYQPKIEENWKSTHGLTINVGAMVPRSRMDGDIEYQHKSLHDQFKLLVDNIQYYKMSIVSKDNYIEAFKCLSLKNKINYNKALEEACGLLLLLPQLILLEFYKYIERFENLNMPDKNKFKDKYIFDEVSCLYYNNNLLTEVTEYFQNCFEVYLILVKEVDNMSLKPKNFNNALSAFEKARFDISYACNIAENALMNYNKDINIIHKLNRVDKLKNKYNNTIFNDKSRNFNSLKKNSDRQRKLRIEACINNKEDDINKNNDFLFPKVNKLSDKKKFNSIIDSDLVSKILKHCKKDIKYEIMTQRINNELDGNYSGDDDDKIRRTHKYIKLNF